MTITGLAEKINDVMTAYQIQKLIEPLADEEILRLPFGVTVRREWDHFMIRTGVGGVTLCHSSKRAAQRAKTLINLAITKDRIVRQTPECDCGAGPHLKACNLGLYDCK